MPLITSINTKLLMIVVCFAAISGVLIGLWQGVEESRRLQQGYDKRLEALGTRYRDRLAQELADRQNLLGATRDSLADSLRRTERDRVPLDFDLERDPDGAVRIYLGESGVFIHRDTDITAKIERLIYHTNGAWLNIEPLLKTQFDAFYLISEERVSRIWPASLVALHRSDHDVTEEIFYTLAEPATNPERRPRWTPIYFDHYPQVWTTSLLVPLYLDDDFIGVVGADLDLSFLFSQLDQLESEFDSLRGFIFSGDGDLILHGTQTPGSPSKEALPYEVFNQGLESKPGLKRFIDLALKRERAPGDVFRHSLQGEPQNFIYQPLPELDWHIGLYYPQSMLDAEHAETMGVIYKNIIGMLLFLSLGLYYGLKWLVTKRVRKLAELTERIGMENGAVRVPENGSDEISQLGRSINKMLDKINELFRGLNHNIQDMERLAYYDQLTGLENRLLFKEQLRTALRSSLRDGHHLALLYLDLDHFKDINDSMGHEAGDQLLIQVGHRLRGCLRDEDSVARLGGDEFAVLLHYVSDAKYASVVAEKLIDALRTPVMLNAQEVVVGTSIGITLAPDDSRDLELLMRNADLAMYQAKYHGRNMYRFYTPDMNRRVEKRLRLERELRQALVNDEFELYYQPQLDMHSRAVVGIEALLRWNHPERGLVLPDQFVPAAEESGLIVPIGKWVVRAACQQASNIQKAKLKNVKVSINVSTRQLNDRDFVEDFKNVVNDSGVEPSQLVVEVTESTLMADAQIALTQLYALRDFGVGLAIDDFGTGYSSLSYLKRLPVTSLKVDRSFVQQLPDDEEDRAITTLIVAMANSLNYLVVVEGLETEPQWEFLRDCGCHFGQGYFFSRPLPADQLMQMLFKAAND